MSVPQQTPSSPLLAITRAPARLTQPVALAIGNFDGVHLGHQALLKHLAERAEGLPRAVLSFHPHPVRVLNPSAPLALISSLRGWVAGLSRAGVQHLYLCRFNEALRAMPYDQFLSRYVIEGAQAKFVLLGPDTCLGRGREGTPDRIREFLEPRGVRVESAPQFRLADGTVPSSRAIRQALTVGDVTLADRLLGRPFELDGRVVRGDQRGRTLGFPTANISCPGRVLPLFGVYAGYADLAGVRYRTVMNIGIRPTFQKKVVAVEAHLLDGPGVDFYGARLRVSCVARVRDEMRFSGLDELRAQITRDSETARRILL